MSHFTVLVVGNNPEEQLAPFQENNCPEEYLSFTDTEEENLKEYETGTAKKAVMPDGRLLNPWDEEFKIKDDLLGIGQVPEGIPVREVPYKEIFPTFEDFMKEWHGHDERDQKIGKYGYWENKISKWDWYELGGRFRGFFKLKHPNVQKVLGEPGVFNNEPEYDSDQALKGQVDFEGMMEDAGKKAKEQYETVERLLGGEIPKIEVSWKEIIDPKNIRFSGMDIEEKRTFFHNQSAMLKLKQIKEDILKQTKEDIKEDAKKVSEDLELLMWLDLENYQMSKEEFIERAKTVTISTFAVIKDGKWFERGKMGWWGIISNEKDEKEWDNQFQTLLSDLPDDTLLSIYDCHI